MVAYAGKYRIEGDKSSSPRGLLESSIHWYATNTDLRSPRRSPLLVAFVARPESSYITGAN